MLFRSKHSLFNKALINLQKLIEESQNIDKKDIIVKSYKLMGDIYSKLFLFREADRFYNETLVLVEDNNFDIPFIEELYHNYSKNSINLDNIESAHEYIIKGVYLCKTSNNNNCFSRFKILESIILKKENSFEQAIQVLEQAEKELSANNSIYRDILFQKFEIYSLLFDIEKLDNIVTLINNFHENSSIDNIEYFKILHDYYEIKKDDTKALFYLNKYHNAYKNKFRYELLERISELKTVLDFKVEIEKNKALEVVNKKNEILLAQKENINQLQTILIIIVLISLVMLGGFTLKIFHNKKQFKFLSETDNLTKINNRRSITNIAEKLYNEKNNFSVILFDIDHFKKVNDTFGHNIGDEVLKIIAKLTKKTLRDTDYVGRYGGEEFLIILPNTEIQKAKDIAERIRLKIQNYDYSDIEPELHTTSSFGVSHYDPSLSLKDIIIEADKKLYFSKDNGRNKVS